MMNRIAALAALFSCALFAPQVSAQDTAPKAEPAVQEDPAKFFLFHMEGVAVDVARADLMYCIDQVKDILSLRDKMGSGGGLIGAIINARMGEIDRFRMRNAGMRKCMNLHGYARYQVQQAEWRLMVNDGDIVLNNAMTVDPVVVDRLAVFAAGPQPTGKRLDP